MSISDEKDTQTNTKPSKPTKEEDFFQVRQNFFVALCMKRSIKLSEYCSSTQQRDKETNNKSTLTKVLNYKWQYGRRLCYGNSQGEKKCMGYIFIIIGRIVLSMHYTYLTIVTTNAPLKSPFLYPTALSFGYFALMSLYASGSLVFASP